MAASVSLSYHQTAATRQDRPRIPRSVIAHSAHDGASSIANNNGEETMDKPAHRIPQDFRATAEQNPSPSIADQVRAALTADFGHLAGRLKVIARAAGGISPRTVERWERGEGVPHLELFLELGKHSPAIQKMVRRLWGLDPDVDPEYAPALRELQRAAVELLRKSQR